MHARLRGALVVVALVAVLMTSVLAPPALAWQRVALVIGNASYAHAPSLANPLNDANDIGAALERLGFAVTRMDDADQVELRRGLQHFSLAASASEMAVVFYAGHGIEVDRRNFLIPVDARLLSDADVEFEAVPLDLLSRAVERAKGLRLIILDACRDNPFAVAMQRSGATRSIGRGLGSVEPSGETLVAYAAKEGTVAADGEGRNSPYTSALLAHLEEPGLEVGLMFRKVRDAVLAATGGRQEPFVYGSLSSHGAYLAALSEPEPAPTPTPQTVTVQGGEDSKTPGADQVVERRIAAEKELLFWESVKDSQNPEELQAYLDRYPEGTYAVLARSRLKELVGPEETPDVQVAVTPDEPERVIAPELPAPAPETVEASLGLERSERRQIQMGLAALGFDPGPADGLFGRRTRAAIADWQSYQGGGTTGHLDAEAAKALLAAGEEETRKRAAEEARKREAMLPGRVFRDCPECPEMVVVPAGSFMMGSLRSESGRSDNEGPQHRVTISEPFAVGRYEVTFAEWDACVAGGGCNGHRPNSYGHDRVLKAVSYVSWEDAKAYVHWLSRKTRKQYRLLSEAEWEYAARAGTRTSRYWGDDVQAQCDHADGFDLTNKSESVSNTEHAPCWDSSAGSASIGSYGQNGFGLSDMLGNQSEWVEDCWHGSYAGAPEDGRAWVTGGDCGKRVLRGGSWNSPPRHLRSAFRIWLSTGKRYYVGLRIARTLTP
ncbi:MAG: SUMF1/EgtB/PvdO family nonheme iron enzyme [Rhodospirillales bacterium]|nr:SUMF1/EgtB/PvdO family nonheme iron enzyme [Rhodospirillales bacterium]